MTTRSLFWRVSPKRDGADSAGTGRDRRAQRRGAVRQKGGCRECGGGGGGDSDGVGAFRCCHPARRRYRRPGSVPLSPLGPEAVPAARWLPADRRRGRRSGSVPLSPPGPVAVPAARRPGGGMGGDGDGGDSGGGGGGGGGGSSSSSSSALIVATRHGGGDCGLVARHFPSKGLRPRCCGDIRTTLSTTPRTTPRTASHDPLSGWHRRSPGARANYLPIPHPFWCSQAMPSIDPMGRRGT